MSSPNERLKRARIRAGFESAIAAAEALGIATSTYISHENGFRGFPASRVPKYARRYKVTEEWLLYGKGSIDDKPDSRIEIPTIIQLEEMVRLALSEVPLGSKFSEYPPIVASALHDMLETIRENDGLRPIEDSAAARQKVA